MLFEIGSSILMAGLAGYSYLKTNGPAVNEPAKIQKIFHNAGWVGGEGETIRLHRKAKFKGGTEYVYQLPLGFDRKKIENNKDILQDGLNIKNGHIDFDPALLLKLKFDKTLIKQIKSLINPEKKSKKEIELLFDGMLRIRVYDNGLPERIKWTEQLLKAGSWAVPIGYKHNGDILSHDFDKAKHLIVAGATGYGKSVILKLIVTTAILQQPENVKLHLIDLKGGASFNRYKNCRQTVHCSRDPKQGQEDLKEIQQAMNDVFTKVVDDGFEDVKEAGIKERHLIVIDEAADLAEYETAMNIITDIARRGRSAGFYLVFATQYPTSQVIQMQTKRNIIARLSYVVDSSTASNVVLDEGGANELPDIPGRGIYKNLRCHTIQTPLISNDEIAKRIKPHITPGGGKGEQTGTKTKEDRKYTLNIEKV